MILTHTVLFFIAMTQSLRDAIRNAPWNALYFCVEKWFFNAPRSLGGWQNLDKGQVCANLFSRPLYEITPEFYDVTCINKFNETIASYCWVALALLCALFLFQFLSFSRTVLESKWTNRPQPITIITELSKAVNATPPRTRSGDSKQRDKETKEINKDLRIVFKQICDTLSFPNADNNTKMEVILKLISSANPLIKRDIPCNLIGNLQEPTLLTLPSPKNE